MSQDFLKLPVQGRVMAASAPEPRGRTFCLISYRASNTTEDSCSSKRYLLWICHMLPSCPSPISHKSKKTTGIPVSVDHCQQRGKGNPKLLEGQSSPVYGLRPSIPRPTRVPPTSPAKHCPSYRQSPLLMCITLGRVIQLREEVSRKNTA